MQLEKGCDAWRLLQGKAKIQFMLRPVHHRSFCNTAIQFTTYPPSLSPLTAMQQRVKATGSDSRSGH